MSLMTKIVDDMKTAMKQKDAARLSTLRMAKATLMNKKIETGEDLSDDEVMKVLNTLVKQRRDSAEQYTSAGRAELAQKEIEEIAVIEAYLPVSATEEEIENAVAGAVKETGASSMKDMGAVMKNALASLSGKTVDGKAVSEAVRRKLS